MNRFAVLWTLMLWGNVLNAQDVSAPENIRTIKLFPAGDQTGFPMITPGSIQTLELHFDDLGNRIRNYYYTYQLCNADWTPSILHNFEYIKGFQNNRINNYRNSSLASVPYIHYQAQLPERNCYPNKPGNYLLKIFLDNDTSKVVFTKRLVMVDTRVNIGVQILQPFNATEFRNNQRLNIAVTTDGRTQVLSPSDLKIVVLQNNNWKTALQMDRPTIYRGNYYEYSDESLTSIPAGKEFRWLDLRSLRLKSDRMLDLNTRNDTTLVEVRPDPTRGGQRYIYYTDINGAYTVETLEGVNPYWQGDYAVVHFSYFPPDNRAFPGRDLYLFGEVSNYAMDTSGKMIYNPEKGAYEKTMLLKQGYYNYWYGLLPDNGEGFPDFSATEGNNYTTENDYTILVYFRPFGSRADELIGAAVANSYMKL